MNGNFELNNLDRSVPIPLYYQLKSNILDQIKSGKILNGDQIPTENELQRKLQISRTTIRHAISELVQEGWLIRKKGKGTFVIHPTKSPNVFRSFEPFYHRIQTYGKTPHTQVLRLEVIEANEILAKEMGINIGTKIISMFRRRLSDDEPVVTHQNYLPYSLCNFVLDYDFTKGSLYEVLMQNTSSKIMKTTTIVSAEKASTEDVKLLNIDLNCPVLVFNTISITYEEKVVDFAFAHYRGDINKFKIESSPENQII